MKLRRRLILAMALFLVLGLAVTDVLTYSAVRSFLYGRIDAQLSASQRLAAHYLFRTHGKGVRPTTTALDERIGPDVYVMVVAPNGATVVQRASGTPLRLDPAPILPRSMRLSREQVHRRGPYQPNPDAFILSSAPGLTYRATATAVPQGTLVSAVPLVSADQTLSSLLRTELVASVAVVAALCLLVLWTVRRGLRPLDDMARTAAAIASGDLTRRMAVEDDGTEVGRLGVAFNAMLAQIEAAFAEKSASEARLRQFVADASHELRTPLTSIRGYAELLRKGAFADQDDRDRALGRVEREAARMGGLVDDLLLLARLDRGRPLQRGAVDLRRICQDVVDDARLTAPDRTVTLEAPEPVTVDGDRDRLVQVAHNLVGNALVHTPAGTAVRVEVRARWPMGELRVSDEGPGLPPPEIDRVFDRFYRADHSRTGQSTGLGLSIVRAIAEALGGRAWARSEPGAGATFTVEVPLAPAPPALMGGTVAPVRGRGGRRVRAPVSGPGETAPDDGADGTLPLGAPARR